MMKTRHIVITGVLLLSQLVTTAVARAENIYKFQDENGIWHFTDRAPETGQDFETIFMEREPEPRVRMRMAGSESSPVYLLFNDFWGPVEIELRLSDAVNVITEPNLPARFVVPGQTERSLVGLGALDPTRGFSYRLHMASVPGPPIEQLPEDVTVYPPFAAGDNFLVSQGFNGNRTHESPDSINAIDIVMPVGTPILAAREGVVMDVEEDFNRAGTDKLEFVDKANHVRILHADGTMALYAHLDLASVRVAPGARVRAGEAIALSGNTGFSTGPHLHFVIQQNIGMEIRSVPFRFYQAAGGAAPPEEQQIISGILPGS